MLPSAYRVRRLHDCLVANRPPSLSCSVSIFHPNQSARLGNGYPKIHTRVCILQFVQNALLKWRLTDSWRDISATHGVTFRQICRILIPADRKKKPHDTHLVKSSPCMFSLERSSGYRPSPLDPFRESCSWLMVVEIWQDCIMHPCYSPLDPFEESCRLVTVVWEAYHGSTQI